jgi:hypothetical protein
MHSTTDRHCSATKQKLARWYVNWMENSTKPMMKKTLSGASFTEVNF